MYGTIFYATRRNWTTNAARNVLPIVLDLVGPRSVVDVGCGTGTWLAEMLRLGVEHVRGIDGAWVEKQNIEIPRESFSPMDLSASWNLEERFDLAMSLEVGEHLPAASAPQFIRNLCGLAPVVLFSAAIPGQGGQNHVNEQWPSYWIDLFRAQGFELFDVIRPVIWKNESIPFWYRQNLLVFVGPGAPDEVRERLTELAAEGNFDGADLAHPEQMTRALQFPGVGGLLRALPYAFARSFAAAIDWLRPSVSGRPLRTVALASVFTVFAVAAVASLPMFTRHREQRDALKLYEESRSAPDAEFIYVNETAGEPVPQGAKFVDKTNRAAIEAELTDNKEDFFLVDEDDAAEFEGFDTAQRLYHVADLGSLHLYRDSPARPM